MPSADSKPPLHQIGEMLEWFRKNIYNGPLRTGVQKAGLESNLRKVYTSLQCQITGGPFPTHREKEVINDLLSEVKDDDVFYDIGAKSGFYSKLVAETRRPSHVVAFEPHPKFVANIENNLKDLNDDIGITIHQYALGNSEGTVELVMDMPPDTYSSSPAIVDGKKLERFREKGVNVAKVDMREGDKIVKNQDIPPPDIVKIDVEGAELNVITGMQNILAKETRTVYCEVHLPTEDDTPSITDYGSSPEKLQEELETLGYRIKKVQQNKRDYHIKAVRKS